jgi:selenocysteine lyase/cysteine desulfurase
MAHAPVNMTASGRSECNIDFLVFSGHKIYAPGSPGVVVGRRDIFDAVMVDEIGGGTVDSVSPVSFDMTAHLPGRMEPGTPNIVGGVLLACVLEILQRIGMAYLHEREDRLVKETLSSLTNIPDVTLYGTTDLATTERVGAIAFNLKGLDHGLVAAVLNDYHNVAVRNDCFCAHPYVRELLLPELWNIDLNMESNNNTDLLQLKSGMVRASMALYTKENDITALTNGIKDILARRDYYSALYTTDSSGNYRHMYYRGYENTHFTPLAFMDSLIGRIHSYSGSMPSAILSN